MPIFLYLKYFSRHAQSHYIELFCRVAAKTQMYISQKLELPFTSQFSIFRVEVFKIDVPYYNKILSIQMDDSG